MHIVIVAIVLVHLEGGVVVLISIVVVVVVVWVVDLVVVVVLRIAVLLLDQIARSLRCGFGGGRLGPIDAYDEWLAAAVAVALVVVVHSYLWLLAIAAHRRIGGNRCRRVVIVDLIAV